MPEEISADFPFESKYQEVLDSKMHYVEEGEGALFLLLHGNTTRPSTLKCGMMFRHR